MAEQQSRSIILEQNKKLSECLLWRMEREYFEKKGIEAWLHEVPFYITSNPYIAKCYSRIVMSYIRDWIAKHPDAKNHPFYVMELGTGPGRFSFYMLKAFEELRKDYNLEDVTIKYVMTDFAKANIDYYKTHHTLQPYIENGTLDFAIHDMDKNVPVKLINAKIELNQDVLVNPLTLFTNYVFDTLSNDAFMVHQGKLYELLVNLSTDDSNLVDNKPVELDKINVEHAPKEINSTYYKDPVIDKILELYKNELNDTSFLMPVSGFRGLNHLKKLANGNLLLISSDKAYSELSSLENLGYPSMSIHGGCFSMMVNAHAIGEYFKNSGGDYFPQPTRRGLKTCVYISGGKFADAPETERALKEYVEKFSTTDYFNVYRHISETAQTAELDVLASALQLSGWDPHFYARISARVLACIPEADQDTLTYLANNMHKVAENYYFMPKVDCILFEVGVFFHATKQFDKAVHYYMQAESFLGGQFSLYYNMALCLHHQDKNKEALDYFKKAGKLDPESKEAADWTEYLQKMFLEKKYEPKEAR